MRTVSLAPVGFLASSSTSSRPSSGTRSPRPNAAGLRASPRAIALGPDAHRAAPRRWRRWRCRRCAGPGRAISAATGPGRSRSRPAMPWAPRSSTRVARTSGTGRARAAAGAAPVAQVPEGDQVVGAAAPRSCGSAWSRRRGGGRPAPTEGSSMPKVSDARARSPAEGGDRRVVGVQHRRRRRRQARDHRRPEVGEVLELPVAVELVAEEVHQHQHPRLELARHLGQRGLVDLEQAGLGLRVPAAGLQQRRGHAGHQVRAGAVGHQGPALLAGARRRPAGRSSSCRWSPRSPWCRGAARAPARPARRAASAAAARPGRVVPPPRPSVRDSRPAARAMVSEGAGTPGS